MHKRSGIKNYNKDLLESFNSNNVQLVTEALKNNNNIEKSQINNYFFLSVINNSIDMANVYLQYGAEIDFTDMSMQTALIKSIISKNFIMTEFLISKNADTNIVDKYHKTALIYACNTLPESINLLIKHNADINFCDNKNKKAIDYLKENGDFDKKNEIIKLLSN